VQAKFLAEDKQKQKSLLPRSQANSPAREQNRDTRSAKDTRRLAIQDGFVTGEVPDDESFSESINDSDK